MVEILVAILVLAVGLLGLAGLQAMGARANQSAMYRTLAIVAANDLAERVRADPNNAQIGASPVWSINADGCNSDPGTGTLQARWKSAFCAFGLPPPPDGDFARIDCSGGGANTCGSGNCTILVRWDDRRGDAAAERAGSDGERDASRATFRLCTRLATR